MLVFPFTGVVRSIFFEFFYLIKLIQYFDDYHMKTHYIGTSQMAPDRVKMIVLKWHKNESYDEICITLITNISCITLAVYTLFRFNKNF